MKRRKIRRNMSEKRLLKLKRSLRRRAKKLRLGKKRTGAYVYGTLRRVRGNPGARYRVGGSYRTYTLEEAKKVADDIFRTRGVIVSIEEHRPIPQVKPDWKYGIYTGRGVAVRRNPGAKIDSPEKSPWIGLKILSPLEALREYSPEKQNPLLFFRTGTSVSPITIANLAKKIGNYNEFDGNRVSGFIRKMVKHYPKVSFVLGREYSPSLYLENVYDDLAVKILAYAKRGLKTDEESYDPLRRSVRLWWD